MPVMSHEMRPHLRDTYRFRPPPRLRAVAPGHQIRTCPNCGERARFRLDPEGTWAICEACGQLA
jgi:Zinc-binding domain of primase-helicase